MTAPPVSNEILVSLPPRAHAHAGLGHAHYSYGFAAAYFLRMFKDRGVQTRVISHPEQFKSDVYARSAGLQDGRHVHLIFRSTEDIRPIAGAYNIACFAWEFPVLKHTALPSEPVTSNQVRMLALCDEVWAPCGYTRSVLERYGLTNVHVIPAPVPPAQELAFADRQAAFGEVAFLDSVQLASFSAHSPEEMAPVASEYTLRLGRQPRLQKVVDGGGDVFLTVCNPGDRRKNLANLIEGFLLAAETADDAVLIVKLATSGKFATPEAYVYELIRPLFGVPHCLKDDRVIFVGGVLSELQMQALYGLADFYVCAPIGEGQNLPLIEAMGHGGVPLSVRNTAMLDYIAPENAVVIAERSYRGLISGLAADVAGETFAIDFADRFQIADAVRRAARLNRQDRHILAARAQETVRRVFSPDAVFPRAMERLSSLGVTRPEAQAAGG